MNRLMLDHHWGLESTERPTHLIMILYSSAHPRTCTWELDPGP